jgi:general secretion pathway protein M
MNERRHMILAWVLIVTVVAAVAATVWLPLTELAQRNHARIVSLDDRVAKIQTLAATQDNLKKSLENMQRSIGSNNSNQFVVAKTPTLGAADLQRRVQAIIVENNARQISSQPLSATNVSDFHKLQVTINFSGSLPAIHDVLYELESGQPRVFIEQLLITKNSARRSRRARTRQQTNLRQAMSTIQRELSVRLMASAYMQNGDRPDELTADR